MSLQLRRAPYRLLVATAIITLLICGAPATWAKDAIQAEVTPDPNGPNPIVVNNGNPYSAGTFAVGTIQLFYTVNAMTFTAGDFAKFTLALADAQQQGSGDVKYPVTLSLNDIGSKNLVLSPVPAAFSVAGAGWTGSSVVTITIPDWVPGDPSLNVDGAELVGNMKMETPSQSHLDTVTNVQVHIRLVHPTACVKIFNFITDMTLANNITSIQVNVNKQGKVTSMNPYGQLSDNVLLANACAAGTYDLLIRLDPKFQTNPAGNPGNAVFTYSIAGYVDPATFNPANIGTGTARGQNLCLTNVTVPANSSFLATVHMGLADGLTASALPNPPVFSFSADLLPANSGCMGSATDGTATVSLPFTTK